MATALGSLELRDLRNGRSHLRDLLDDEARPAMLDDLGNDAPLQGDDRRSARHRRKVEAMKSYRTQFAALEADGQRRLTHPDLVRREVVWIALPPSYSASRRGAGADERGGLENR